MTVDGAFQAVLPDYEITAELGGAPRGSCISAVTEHLNASSR